MSLEEELGCCREADICAVETPGLSHRAGAAAAASARPRPAQPHTLTRAVCPGELESEYAEMRARNAEILDHLAERSGSARQSPCVLPPGNYPASSRAEEKEEVHRGREEGAAFERGAKVGRHGDMPPQVARISLEAIDTSIRTHQSQLQKMVRAGHGVL